MNSVRRWYILLVATISIQAVAWALIALLRNLLGVWGDLSVSSAAFQIAVIVIGLPVFLIHWIWAQRLAAADLEERGATLRRLYLYGNMAGFLAPWAANAYDLARGLLGLLLDPAHQWYGGPQFGPSFSPLHGALHALAALLVLGLLWLYHWRVASADNAAVPLAGNSALIRRLALFGFSTAGLVIFVRSGVDLLRWLLFLPDGLAISSGAGSLTRPVAGLLVGLPLWVLPWRMAQGLFYGPAAEERASALRKFYLHAAVFFSALAAVSSATLILAGLLRRAFGLDPQGDIRGPLALLLVTAVVWAYHSLSLRADAALIPEAPRQARVRRISWYLVASIGLAAALVGLGGTISALIRALSAASLGNDLREQLAWFLAALAAGLPVWLLTWRRAQGAAEAEGPAGDDERGSLARKIYLYGFLFAATLTVLSGLVYIVYRLLGVALGEPFYGSLIADLAQAIAFSLIAAAVLVYHGWLLRREGRRRQQAEAAHAAALRVALLDLGDGSFGRAVVDRLRHEIPGLSVSPLGLTAAARAGMGAGPEPVDLPARLAEADLIIGPWQIALPSDPAGGVAAAVSASPARKLLLPTPAEGWAWAGVEPWSDEAGVSQIVQAVRQLLNGEPIRPVRPASPLAVVGAAVGGLLLLVLLMIVATTVANFI